MPDNEIDELADNFFCHLHDHDHNHNHHDFDMNNCKETDLTSVLNPLRDTAKIRKSILSNVTTYLLNEKNHIETKLISIDEENLTIRCSNCQFNIGFKSSSIFKLFC
jgi:hypothetical protein